MRMLAMLLTTFVMTACGGQPQDEGSELAASRGRNQGQSQNVQSRGRYDCAFDAAALERRIDELSARDQWLSYSEGRPGENSSGHAMMKHVSKDEQWLRARLQREPNISGSSSFPDARTAEAFLEGAFEARKQQIFAWLANRSSDRKLSFTEYCDDVCGISMRRNARAADPVRGDGRAAQGVHRDGPVVLRADDLSVRRRIVNS